MRRIRVTPKMPPLKTWEPWLIWLIFMFVVPVMVMALMALAATMGSFVDWSLSPWGTIFSMPTWHHVRIMFLLDAFVSLCFTGMAVAD
jgi:hypothetical protein